MVAFAVWSPSPPAHADDRPCCWRSALVGVGILPQALQRPDSTHLLWVTCVAFPFAAVTIVEVVSPVAAADRPAGGGGHRRRVRRCRCTFVVAALFTFRYYILHTRISVGQARRRSRSSTTGGTSTSAIRAYVAVQAAIDDLAALAEPGDRLLVGPNDLRRTMYSDVFFYCLFPELEPATYYIEMDPGLADAEGSSLAADVPSADWVLLTNFWTGWYEPNASIGVRIRRTEPGARATSSARSARADGPPGHPLRRDADRCTVRILRRTQRPGPGRKR